VSDTHPPSPARPAFSMRIEPHGNTVVLRALGVLDIAVAETFEAELRKALATDGTTVILDLGEVGFIDSSGLRALLVNSVEAKLDGDRLRIRRDLSPAVQRSFEMTGVEDRLPFVD
jgi:anti-anti-sigma factor